jgi:predicted porin
MKKTLIALAALSATASFAQSSVTLSGLFDLGYRSVAAPETYGDTKGVIGTGGSATTAILIQGTEEISKGLKATFRYEMNPDLVGGSGLTGTSQSVNSAGTVYTGANTSANGYNFLGLESAEIGGIKIGRLNTGTLSAWGVSSVFGTALGSGYGSAGQFSRFGGTASTFWNTAPTRFNNAVEYQTPNLSGLTARFLFVPKVNQSSTADTTDLASTSSSASGVQTISANSTGNVVNPGVNRVGVSDLSLAYSTATLNVMIAQQKITVGDQGVHALVGVGPSAATANTVHKFNTLAANYTMGDLRVHAGMWSEKQNLATPVDVAGRIFGARYAMGNIALMASMARTDDKSTANVDRKISGLGVDYSIGGSKRSTLWARYENRDANKNISADTNAAGTTKTTAVGIRHTF